MKNRFRGEADAYAFLLVAVIVHCAVVTAAHFGGHWVTLSTLVVLTPLAVALVFRKPAEEVEPVREWHPPSGGPRRILVVANETVAGEELAAEVCARADDETEVLVVCPALNSRLRHWTSDEDHAKAHAQGRLDASLERLAAAGVDARGHVGDADPLQAIEDALRTFGASELIVSTHPPERSHWLARNVTERAQKLFGLPVTHVVTDLDTDAPAPEAAVA